MIWHVLDRDDAVRATALALALVSAIFTLWPGIDVWFSARFFDPHAAHWLGRGPGFEALRETIRVAALTVPVLALGAVLVAIVRPCPLGLPARVWGFVLTLYLIGPGLLVNAGLKAHWGRARPDAVTEFGGAARFTPPLVPTDQCARNCSFSSGEAAGATAFALSLLLLAACLPEGSVRLRRVILCLALSFVLLGPALRVMAGRHFVSDTLFSILFTVATAQILWPLFRPLAARDTVRAAPRGAVDTP